MSLTKDITLSYQNLSTASCNGKLSYFDLEGYQDAHWFVNANIKINNNEDSMSMLNALCVINLTNGGPN